MTVRRAGVLPRAFFHRTAPEVARDLLGAVVVSRMGRAVTAARIVETEAYLGRDDPASHAYLGRRHDGNRSIYGPPGTWYVYRSYGVHWCANLVTGPPGIGAAVLLRGVVPVEGVPAMIARRRAARSARGGGGTPLGRRASRGRDPTPLRRLCDGPGKLCQALGITRALDGRPMRGSPVLVVAGERVPDARINVTARVGITRAADWPLRFVAVQ